MVSPIHALPDLVPWGCGCVGHVTGWGKLGGIPPELYSLLRALWMIRSSICQEDPVYQEGSCWTVVKNTLEEFSLGK